MEEGLHNEDTQQEVPVEQEQEVEQQNAPVPEDPQQEEPKAVKLYTMACAYEEMNPSKRRNMEDVHRIVPNLDGDPHTAYFAVYDGHGGRGIVEFIETALENNIATELKAEDNACIQERIARAFLITDIQSNSLQTPAGATAVSCLIRYEHDQRILYTANVGDSRAVLCQGTTAYRLSYDHKAEDAAEQRRIEQAGGFIQKGRVLGFLAITRSFGDHAMKDFVTCHPHITTTRLDAQPCPFLIVACDGIWDVISDQEAVDIINERYAHEGPFDDAAKLLVEKALERDSTDNITAVVIFL